MNSPVAIDLGDAFCRVGLYRQHDGRVRILPDFEVCGSCYSIPSCVAFVNNARLVGTAARMQSVSDPARTVCRIKRLLGKSYSEVVELCGNAAIQMTPATDGSDHIIIKDEFYPEEIVAVLINKMRGLITYSAKQCVKDVVITVPAYFNDAQRQATLDAAEIAGVRVAALLNETTAAAFFYARTAKERPTNVLFYDLGGGHLSATVARVSESEVIILGTASTQKVSGSEFTDRFVAHVSERVIQSYGQDPTLNTSAYALLYLLCDRIKCELSYNLTSTLKLRGFLPNILIQMTITRAEFEEVCQDIFRAAMEPVDKAIQCADLTIDDIDDVTVLGGSARIPMIETLLLEKFNKRRINKSLHSEETVVYGATLYAAQLAKLLPNPVQVCDVIDHGIGIEQPRAIVSPLIHPNTQIPCSVRRIFSTTPGGEQSCLNLRLYEGNRARTTENNFLGFIDISELRPAFGGIHQAIVELEVDKSGILKAVIFPDARLHSGKHLEIRKTGLSVESKHNACKAFARSLSGDAQMRRLSEYRHYLESFAYLLLSATGAKELKLQEPEIQCLRRQSSEILRWLRSNPNAALDETDEKIRVVQDTIISNVRCPLEGILHYALHFTNHVNVHE